MNGGQTIEFETTLDQHIDPKMGTWHIAHVPLDIEAIYGTKGRVRCTGTINGLEVKRALIPAGNGNHMFMVGKDLRQQLKLRLGDPLHVKLTRDADQDKVELAEEMEIALDLDQAAKARFDGFTPGLQRSLNHYVASAKREETRAKRAVELCRKIANGELHMDRAKKKDSDD